MSIIKENCKCGAKFRVDGSDTFCSFRYNEFLKAHEVCRSAKIKSQKPVIESKSSRPDSRDDCIHYGGDCGSGEKCSDECYEPSGITLSEFIEDLEKEMKENKGWRNGKLEFCTIDGYGAKYLSMYNLKGTIYIAIGTKEEQKTTLSEFVRIITEKMKENKGWGDKKVRFSLIYEDGSKDLPREYLSVYDLNDNIICIDIGTEEEDAEYIEATLG